MARCPCDRQHAPRRVALTGGPGAGKTAILELARQSFCAHLRVLPEAAGIVYGGGFPRSEDPEQRRAAQRAIYFVQRELEASVSASNAALVLCDRGSVDGAAYWPGPNDLWSAVGTTLHQQWRRYDAVIHVRTPNAHNGYNHNNPLRRETADEANAIDARIACLWAGHPRRFVVEATTDFLEKASQVIALLRNEMPDCCQSTHAAVETRVA